MAALEDKENFSPLSSIDPLQLKSSSPARLKTSRKGRSKSIGPGGLDNPNFIRNDARKEAKNRRKSTYVPATKSIMANDAEKKERQAARRATLANRRVSFAPEATLHTWDVIEFARDQTTSTDSSEGSRRTSDMTRASSGGSPYKRGSLLDSDPPSTPLDQADEPAQRPVSPALQRSLHQSKRRRSSGIPPMNFNNPDDAYSSSGISESSDVSESEDDDAGTAMSLETMDVTGHSVSESEGSTGSSARLEAALREAAAVAGTRGIEYDEFGEQSMELAAEEVTNAFQPWAAQQGLDPPMGSAFLDQENVNPFSPAFKARLASGTVSMPSTVAEEDTGDLSMDVTRAIGGIVPRTVQDSPGSQLSDGTMDLTQAVGHIQDSVPQRSVVSRTSQKRRRSTANTGSPGAAVAGHQSKRRRSSTIHFSTATDAITPAMAVERPQNNGSPVKSDRRKSNIRLRSSSAASEQDDATMDFTQAVGGIRAAEKSNHTSSSFDENEELTMELTTVFGGINSANPNAHDEEPTTPQQPQSPLRSAANTTPKDQTRYKDVPEDGPKKLLTPLLQKQVILSSIKRSPAAQKQSPLQSSPRSTRYTDCTKVASDALDRDGPLLGASTSTPSPPKTSTARRASLGGHTSPLRASPIKNPVRKQISTTPDSLLRQQLDAQLEDTVPSPIVQKQLRDSPTKILATPEKVVEATHDHRRLAESIKLLSTPRKETLKTMTPKKQTSPLKLASPAKTVTPKAQQQSGGRVGTITSPAPNLLADIQSVQQNENHVEHVRLQDFLDLAGVRFMDLTTTRRRMTTAPTPSKVRSSSDVQDELAVDFQSAIVAGVCTLPELEMYEHACHELRRYISDGKKVVREIESETAKDTPPLVQVYMMADLERKTTLDAQMRDIKTHARLRSKEMWYAWRSQLLEDLLKGLSGVAEGLIKDDEMMQRQEEILDRLLPSLSDRHDNLQAEAEALAREAAAINEDDTEELDTARAQVQAITVDITERQRLLDELRGEMQKQEESLETLEESREEFSRAIEAADQVKGACRGLSLDEVATLKDAIAQLEESSGWSIVSAYSSPPSVTMTYRAQIQLFYHPNAFNGPANMHDNSNAPISLVYTKSERLGTIPRFFLQFLQASLQALPQRTTRVADLLNFVGRGWDTALAVAEAERTLCLECSTETSIKSDECLSISAHILLPAVRTKVRIGFNVLVDTEMEDHETLNLGTNIQTSAQVVYGESYNEDKMRSFVEKGVDGGFEGWNSTVGDLKKRLIARGPKVLRN